MDDIANTRLAKLVAEGRRTRAALERKQQFEALAIASKGQQRQLARTARSLTWTHVLTKWWVFVPVPAALVLIVGAALDAPIWVRIVASLVTSGLTYLLARVRVAGAFQREHEWVGALPFELQGYFEVLGADYVSGITYALRFVDEESRPEELLKDAFAAFDPQGKVTQEGAFEASFSSYGNNRKARRYTHRLCERVLFPLHEAHPIASIVLTRVFAGASD